METIIQSNIISVNVSINIDALKAIKQRALKRANIDTLVSGRRIYRKVLRTMQSAERATAKHPAIANSILWLIGIALVAEVLFFA